MQHHFGNSGSYLLEKELSKTGISDVEKADVYNRRMLVNSLTEDLLEPIMSKSRVALARSRLMGILDVEPILTGLPPKEKMTPRVVEYFKKVQDFIVKEELSSHTISAVSEGVDVRTRILEGIMEKHLGSLSRILLGEKMRELGIKSLDDTVDYVKIMLMESIITSLINVCVKPVTARMIRSEITSILGLDVYVVQCMEHDVEAAVKLKEELEKDEEPEIHLTAEKTRDFEDLALLVVREESGKAGIHNPLKVGIEVKAAVMQKILSRIFGGVAAHIVDSMGPRDAEARVAFMQELMKTYLVKYMKKEDVVVSMEKIMKSMALA
jgi:hypothetical protein